MTDALAIAKHVDETGTWHVLSIDPSLISPLAKALASVGRDVDGYVTEALLIRLSELGDPIWATELVFESEAGACIVRCRRRTPLAHLARRLQRRLEAPARLRQLAMTLPEE